MSAPPLRRILAVDWLAFCATLTPLPFWGIYALSLQLGYMPTRGSARIPPGEVLMWTLALSALCLLGVAWRVGFHWSVFRAGEEAPGQLTRVESRRGTMRLEFAYTWHGHPYQAKFDVMESARTAALRAGDPVPVVLHSAHPRWAVIKTLYM